MLFSACEALGKYYLRFHVFSGIDVFLVDVSQRFNLKPFRVNVTGNGFTSSQSVRTIVPQESRKNQVQLVFTGLSPSTSYQIAVEILDECSYNRTVQKNTRKFISNPVYEVIRQIKLQNK